MASTTVGKHTGAQTYTSAERAARQKDPKGLQDRMIGSGADKPVVASDRVVLALMKTFETTTVVEELLEEYADVDTFIVEDVGPYYRLENSGSIEIDTEVMEPLIGHHYDVFDLMVNVSTTVGRAYNDGNTFIITTELMGLDKPLPRYRDDGSAYAAKPN
ncbi:MmoB/DmpM family protein [Candidatus Mycobacterium methanotrophicum]|uniref:MmoB/DmpM family protein n=1 Tax=Candidatus Mycobacterium methanotrophicum TaxID=2943498 RepID=A0ABY4QM25_9MYCO|nr:MmoB/DmpM family protein [Candidatus Mycobacterium methanotrophicum]UQX11659.1 MmoB/DmpM family protein [Candidatus Mycobacterium methanotrophicum]